TCCVPSGIRFEDLYERMKRRGYIVYACKDVLADRFMQVANMGALPVERIDAFLAMVAEVIAELRAEALRGQAISEAAAAESRGARTWGAEPARATAQNRSSKF